MILIIFFSFAVTPLPVTISIDVFCGSGPERYPLRESQSRQDFIMRPKNDGRIPEAGVEPAPYPSPRQWIDWKYARSVKLLGGW
jgi:hypothetical protein